MLDAAPCGYWNPLLFNGRVFSSRLLCSGARIRGVSRKQRPLPLFYICILIAASKGLCLSSISASS
jgi:hypothetical protein